MVDDIRIFHVIHDLFHVVSHDSGVVRAIVMTSDLRSRGRFDSRPFSLLLKVTMLHCSYSHTCLCYQARHRPKGGDTLRLGEELMSD